jgi:hypothetical protein
VNECTGPFIFHTLQDGHLREFKDLPQSEDSAVYLGQMVPNFLGTEFTLVDHQQKRRNELGFLVYNRNVFGRIPNFLKVAFPREEEILSMSSNTSTTTSTMDMDQKPIIIDLLTDDQLLSRTPTRLQNTNHHRRRITTTNVGTTTSFFHQNTSLNGRISERFRLRQNKRDVPLVERLRNFSLDDLNLNFDGNVWQDADDHTAIAKAMRFKETRSRSQTLTPYGAIEQEEYADMIVFETKKPSWNEELGAWTLNFNGRVKVASKKNLLMVAENQNLAMEEEFGGEEKIYLRFGKVTKTRFTLDHQAPISPILALAIACSSFAHKIVVT